MSGWNNPLTAQKYDQFSKTYGSYHQTSHDLVRLAAVTSQHTVVDLACGTGVTSGALLAVMGENGRIYALDLSPAMLTLAQENIQAKNITFRHSAAESLHEVVPQPVDRVVCNSAFWQMQVDEVLQSIRQILRANGHFAFNIPSSFSPVCDEQKRPINLRALMRQVAQEEFGLPFDEPLRERSSSPFTEDGIKQILARNDYTLLHHERIIYEGGTPESAKAFCAIPIMSESTLPGVDYDTRMEILERAYGRLDTTEAGTSAWDFYLTQP